MNPYLKDYIERGLDSNFNLGQHNNKFVKSYVNGMTQNGPEYDFIDVGFILDDDCTPIRTWHFYNQSQHNDLIDEGNEMFLSLKPGIYILSTKFYWRKMGHSITVMICKDGKIKIFDSDASLANEIIDLSKIWKCYGSERHTKYLGMGERNHYETLYFADGSSREVIFYSSCNYQASTHDQNCVVWSLSMALLFKYFDTYNIEFTFPGRYYSIKLLKFMTKRNYRWG